MGSRCSFCETTDGPFLQVEGLFTVLMCTSCQAVRQASPTELLADYDPGGLARSRAVGIGSSGRGNWRGTVRPSIPAGAACYELVRPYPNQLQRVVFRRVRGASGELRTKPCR